MTFIINYGKTILIRFQTSTTANTYLIKSIAWYVFILQNGLSVHIMIRFMFSVEHCSDVTWSDRAYQITGIWTVCSVQCSGVHQRKSQIFTSLAFMRGIHRLPVNFRHKRPVMRKMFSFDDVIMKYNEMSVYFHPGLVILSDVKFTWSLLWFSSTLLLLSRDK